ncbi:PAS domain S-box protein [Pontibacter sp. G13]|uniref:sensor histidine kinase n=1 Tax=Pontibacter sp. G13 TaxID=3074898 RepID=UPI00288B257F|nr:PAS domain S-box protein [Pontibacter sp. G13]WNJ17775.1 PAS domain S-box protein [Pontibacter sp. G13]
MNQLDQAIMLKAIFESAIDGIITISDRGVITAINPAAADIFGYHPDEITGRNISMLMPSPDREAHDRYIHNYLSSGTPKIIGIGREVHGLRKNGTVFPFRLAVAEMELEDGTRMFAGTIHELTKEKQAEASLKRYAAELERSNKDLEHFAYVSSHDLQEPLRKIQAFGSRIIDKEGEKLSEKGQDYLVRMLNASNRLQRLIEDLLSFSRVSTRANPFLPVDLEDIIGNVCQDLDLAIQENQATVTYRSLPHIHADEIQIHQLLQNLVSNGIKFRKPDVAPEIQIWGEEIHLDAESGMTVEPRVRIYVSDNGIGFEEKYLDRIFDMFQRLEGRKYEGSGIGLSICRRIAQRHGGDINAMSKPGQGSTFVIELAKHPKPQQWEMESKD